MYGKIRMVTTRTLPWFMLSAISLANEEKVPSADQSLIEANSIENKEASYTYFKEKSDAQRAGDAAMLFHIPGLTLSENQGPLGPANINYRGLSNNRFRIDLEGLSLNNPINGLNDANSMFLFAAKRLDSGTQSLSISLPEVEKPFAQGVFGYGSQNTLKVGASTGMLLDKSSSLFSALQFSQTNGRFSFFAPGHTSSPLYRLNNDQNRIQAVMKYQRQTLTGGAHALAAVNSHEGGIPGYAFSPTINLRSKALFSGLSTGFSQKINKSLLSVTLANSLFNYDTTDKPEAFDHFLASTHELTVGLDSLTLPKWLDLKMAEVFVVERAYTAEQTRIGGGLVMKRSMTFSGRLKPKTFATFGMMGYGKYGFVFKKDLGFSIEPSENLNLIARAVRSQRLPTFMEMYANNRFFAGNEDLKKESLWDFEISSNMRFANHTRLQLTAYAGFLSDVIVYVPFMATRLRPTNTDAATRYGVDMSLSVEPTTWALFETKNALLRTRIKSTNAPLPQSPPFLGLTRIRLGPEDVGTLSLQSRYKGASSTNVYGTLNSNAYILFDALASFPIGQFLALSLSVTNVFNVKTARDFYEMPLPGTTFFGQIELGNS